MNFNFVFKLYYNGLLRFFVRFLSCWLCLCKLNQGSIAFLSAYRALRPQSVIPQHVS